MQNLKEALSNDQLKQFLIEKFPQRYSKATTFEIKYLDLLFVDKLVRLSHEGDIIVFALLRIKGINELEQFHNANYEY